MSDTEYLEDFVTLALPSSLTDRPNYAVTLIKAGPTLHRWRFPAPVLQSAAARFQGCACFVDHTTGFFDDNASIKDLAGVVTDVSWDPDVSPQGALTGRLALNRTPAANWLEALLDQIISDREEGLPVPNVGLSADLLAAYYLDGDTRVATQIRRVQSLDVVFDPAAGGAFDRVLNSMKGGISMKDDKHTPGATFTHQTTLRPSPNPLRPPM